MKQTILVVDDSPENIDVLTAVLSPTYRVKAAINGEKGIKIAETTFPDLILLDIMMPNIDGFEVCRRLKENPKTKQIPIVFVTAKIEAEDEMRGLSLGAVDYITKPISPPVVLVRVKTHLALFDQNRELEMKVKQRTLDLQNSQFEIIKRLGMAAEYKDNETGMHVVRMSHYAHVIARMIGMHEPDLLLHAMPMHDVGKIGIPDHILLKKGKLDADEWAIMLKHPEIGAKIIGEHEYPLLRMARVVSLTHHERWDGKGYPAGLAGEEIPLEGRIAAIADVFDALTTERPYKKAWDVEKAVQLLQTESGKHFDPHLVEVFMENLDEILVIKEMYAE